MKIFTRGVHCVLLMGCFSLYRSSTRKIKCYASSLLDNWLMFDDDKVMPVSGEDVLKLSGGGEFLALFRGNKIRQTFPEVICLKND